MTGYLLGSLKISCKLFLLLYIIPSDNIHMKKNKISNKIWERLQKFDPS